MNEIKKVGIEQIQIRMDLYPRQEPDVRKIQEYSENIENLPPIIVNQNMILIDGLHRLKAHKQAGLSEINVIIEETKSDNDVMLRAIETNATHGLQLSNKDKQSLAVKLFDNSNAERLIKSLSVSEKTFYNWTSRKAQQFKEERNEKILQLYLQCHTEQQIADKLGITQPTVTNILNDFIKNGKIAEIYKNFKPQLYAIWNQHELNNDVPHFGSFPIEFMENLLYYYTEPFDIVYDPFGGGGTTIDACKKWFRRYYVFDRKPIPAREDEIKKWDVKDGLPDIQLIDFVFLDPPYWKQAENKYSEDKEDLANMSLEEYYSGMFTLFKEIKKRMKPNSRIAFVISGTETPNDMVYEDHAFRFMQELDKLGFKLEKRIILPYSSQQYNGNVVNIAKEKKVCLNLHRDLVIFRR